MDEVLSPHEVKRVWDENHRSDGSLIPLSELYPSTFRPAPLRLRVESDNKPEPEHEIVEWLELRLAEARDGKFTALALDAVLSCQRHRNCFVYPIHFYTQPATTES